MTQIAVLPVATAVRMTLSVLSFCCRSVSVSSEVSPSVTAWTSSRLGRESASSLSDAIGSAAACRPSRIASVRAATTEAGLSVVLSPLENMLAIDELTGRPP